VAVEAESAPGGEPHPRTGRERARRCLFTRGRVTVGDEGGARQKQAAAGRGHGGGLVIDDARGRGLARARARRLERGASAPRLAAELAPRIRPRQRARRQIALEHLARDLEQKPARRARLARALHHALRGPRQHEPPTRARDPPVREAPFFLELVAGAVLQRAAVREAVLLEARHVNDALLAALCRVRWSSFKRIGFAQCSLGKASRQSVVCHCRSWPRLGFKPECIG